MNTTFKTLLSAMAISALLFTACKKDDDDPVSCNYLTELQDELDALNAAAAAYGNDPTNPQKCQAYKNAAQAYLDELEDHIDCATLAGQQAEIQAAIDSAQDSVNAIQC